MLLDLRHDGTESQLYGMIGNAEEIHAMVKEFGDERALGQNLDLWKEALKTLGLTHDPNSKYNKLSTTLRDIEGSQEMAGAVEAMFTRNQERLTQSGSKSAQHIDTLLGQAKLSQDGVIFHERLVNTLIKFEHEDKKATPEIINEIQTEIDEHIMPALLGEEGNIKRVHEAIGAMRTARRNTWQIKDDPQKVLSAGADALHTFMQNFTGQTPLTDREALHRMANSASTVPTISSTVRQLQHGIALKEIRDLTPKSLNKYTVPLMAIGGVLGLLVANSGPQDDNFSQGKLSRGYHDPLRLNSEMPGRALGVKVWRGETDPFQIDITFKGFVADKRAHEALVSQVYDSVTGSMEFKSTKTEVRDIRSKNHRMAAMDMLGS